MDSGHLFFDSSSFSCHGNMLYFGNSDNVFGGAKSMICMDETRKRSRPFFSSPEEMYDNEYYDEQMPKKKRRLTAEQVHMLEKSFETENKLEPERKTHIAKQLGLQPRQVAVWFQNRRARWKTRQLEKDYDSLKSSYDSLLSDYDSIVKEHDKLKSEVVCLKEKLLAKEVISGQNSEPLSIDTSDDVTMQFRVKVEDRLSTGGCRVVDEEGLQFVDTYIRGVQSEEDDVSDAGQYAFSDVFAAPQQQYEDGDGEPLGWWVWS